MRVVCCFVDKYKIEKLHKLKAKYPATESKVVLLKAFFYAYLIGQKCAKRTPCFENQGINL